MSYIVIDDSGYTNEKKTIATYATEAEAKKLADWFNSWGRKPVLYGDDVVMKLLYNVVDR